MLWQHIITWFPPQEYKPIWSFRDCCRYLLAHLPCSETADLTMKSCPYRSQKWKNANYSYSPWIEKCHGACVPWPLSSRTWPCLCFSRVQRQRSMIHENALQCKSPPCTRAKQKSTEHRLIYAMQSSQFFGAFLQSVCGFNTQRKIQDNFQCMSLSPFL